MICLPLCGGEIPPQFFGGSARPVTRRIALDAPALAQQSDIDHAEPEPLDQVRVDALGVRVVARNGQRPPVRRACRLFYGKALK